MRFLLALMLFSSVAGAAGRWRVALDPGHEPADPGALGCRGAREIVYNDEMTALLAASLRGDKRLEVVLTRKPGEALSKAERVERLKALKPDVVLSLHHDSGQAQFLRETTAEGKPASCAKRSLGGFTLFVSKLNPFSDQSLALARGIARGFVKLGRKPATHHAEPIAGENRPWADKALGVHWYDLAILRGALVPAVLMEVGVIVDEADERFVASPDNRKKLVASIHQALVDFLTSKR